MKSPDKPGSDSSISIVDVRQKMDEFGTVVSETLVEHRARLYSTGLLITIGSVYLAYRLGKFRGRRSA